jgi:hypothetical protein
LKFFGSSLSLDAIADEWMCCAGRRKEIEEDMTHEITTSSKLLHSLEFLNY